MGQKVNPIGLRIGVNKSWDSIWFDEKNYANKLHEDIIIRNYINNKLNKDSQIDSGNILIKSIYADKGPTMKRFRPAAMGRAARILKRTSHLTVIVENKK